MSPLVKLRYSDAVTSRTIVIGRHDGSLITVVVEVAETAEEQAQGLAGRSLPDVVMAFPIMPARVVAMHMGGVLFPLDLVFVDAAGRISSIAEHVPPQAGGTWCPDTACALVVEAPGGWARAHGISGGEFVAWV